MKTIRIDHDEDDLTLLQEVVRRAIGWLLNGMLAAAIAAAGALIYVAVSERADAQSDLGRQDRRLEVLGGNCRYGKVGNYVWHNTHYEHELDMTSGCALIAVSSVSRGSGLRLGWRVAYADLGLARANAVFPMRDEDQVSVLPSGTACDPDTGLGCIGRGYGAQNARGISLGYVAEHNLWGSVLGAELGVFGYYGRWRVHVAPEPPSTHDYPLDIDWAGWQLTPFVGVTFRRGYLIAMLRAYGRVRAAQHGCGGCSGIANSTALQAVVGVSAPF